MSDYSYKLIVDKLERSDWNNIQIVREDDGIVIVRFNRRNNKPVWVAWSDNEDKRTVTVSGIYYRQVKITDSILPHRLSPIDKRNNQKVGVSIDEVNRVIKLWNKEKGEESQDPYSELYQYIHPLVIGAVDRADSSHSNEILNILETADLQVYFQNDKDWFYRSEERRWVTMNDNSNWRKIIQQNGKIKKSIFHIT